jgi:hypothetical protein
MDNRVDCLMVFSLVMCSKFHTANRQVSLYTFVPPLASSMMAPGLPGVATKYAITNQTYVAMTLSIFLLSLAVGVSTIPNASP